MLSWILDHYIATISITVLIVAACGVIAWFVPPLRRLAVGVGLFVASAAAIFTRGYLTGKKEAREKSEKAVKKAEEKFNEIERRPDSSNSVDKRLRDGNF